MVFLWIVDRSETRYRAEIAQPNSGGSIVNLAAPMGRYQAGRALSARFQPLAARGGTWRAGSTSEHRRVARNTARRAIDRVSRLISRASVPRLQRTRAIKSLLLLDPRRRNLLRSCTRRRSPRGRHCVSGCIELFGCVFCSRQATYVCSVVRHGGIVEV